MITCRSARKWLPLLDSEENGIDIPKRAALEEHLEQCSACREYRTEQIRVRETLSQSGKLQFSMEYLQDFTLRLNQRLDSSEKPKGWLRFWMHQLDASPLPTLAGAAAGVWLVMIIAMQFPGVGLALLQVVGR
jgi:hypothetical protein